MGMIVHLAMITALLTQAEPKVLLSGDCARVNLPSVEKQMSVELARIDIRPTTVSISCDDEVTTVVATTTDREVRSSMNLKTVADVAASRTLALAAVELVLEAQNRIEVSPRAPIPDVVKEAPAISYLPRVWIRAGGGAESGAPFLGVAQVLADARLWRFLWVGGGLGYQRGGATFLAGNVQADAVDGMLTAEAVGEVGQLLFLIGAGARIGSIWLRGEPKTGVDAGQLQSLRLGPLLRAGIHVLPLNWLSLGVDVHGGWHLRRISGLIDGTSQVSFANGWFHAVASVGVRL